MKVHAKNNDENQKTGPAGSIESGSEGVTGPSREVSQRDPESSGAEITGQEENSELEWGKQHVKEEQSPAKREPVPQPVRTVFRKTELHGATLGSTPDAGKKTRRRTMQSLESPGVTVSYHTFEVAFKDFICSLMERQDMMGEDLLLHIADLQQQIDALEDPLNSIKKQNPSLIRR